MGYMNPLEMFNRWKWVVKVMQQPLPFLIRFGLTEANGMGFEGPSIVRSRDFIRGIPYVDEYGGDRTWPFELTYRSLADREVTPESLEGEWTFSLDGVQYLLTILDGTATAVGNDGCTYAGPFHPWPGGSIAFKFILSPNCGDDDALQGAAVNIDVQAGDRAALEFFVGTGVHNAAHFVAVRK